MRIGDCRLPIKDGFEIELPFKFKGLKREISFVAAPLPALSPSDGARGEAIE